jgi:hypothetical protein
MIIGIRAQGHAARIWRAGRDAEQEMRRRPLFDAGSAHGHREEKGE